MSEFPRIILRDVPATDKPHVGEITVQMVDGGPVSIVPVTVRDALHWNAKLSHQLARRAVLPEWEKYLPNGAQDGEGA